jgi:hypothetical protein
LAPFNNFFIVSAEWNNKSRNQPFAAASGVEELLERD